MALQVDCDAAGGYGDAECGARRRQVPGYGIVARSADGRVASRDGVRCTGGR